MEEMVEIMKYLLSKVEKLINDKNELIKENARILRMIEEIRPFVKANANASETVAKNDK
jgi:hypothetical protein